MRQIFAFTLLVSCAVVTAQTPDTTFIYVSQEKGSLEKQQLADRYNYAFSTLEPTRWLLKLNLSAFSGNQNDLARLSAEVKLIPAISLQGSYGIGYGQGSVNDYAGKSLVSHRFGLESRWYYAMPRRIRHGKSANNMSGNYLGLEAAYAWAVETQHFTGDKIIHEENTLVVRYGVQRRLFRYGFLDIGFGVGAKYQPPSSFFQAQNSWRLFANSQIGLGLALAYPKVTASAGNYCDVLRCFREERQMWKVDLYNLIRINNVDDYKGQFSLGYERKIGASPFSLEVAGAYGYSHYHAIYQGDPADIVSNGWSYSGYVQPRYYYTQKKHIATGKTGNNLSGLYVGVQYRQLQETYRELGYQCGFSGCSTVDWQINSPTRISSILTGIQHRLFQHGFVDLQIMGSKVRGQAKYINPQNKLVYSIDETGDFKLNLKLRAGLAF